MDKLFADHLDQVKSRILKILEEENSDGLIVGSGPLSYFYQDDQAKPFRPNHQFAYLCPATGPDHHVVLVPGEKPRLFFLSLADFWHEPASLGEAPWLDSFVVEMVSDRKQMLELLKPFSHYDYLGPDVDFANEIGATLASDRLQAKINWSRSFKTNYEVTCIRQATELAAAGHHAAAQVFRSGGSEFAIHHAYLQALQVTDDQLPYRGIVGVGRHAAVLHYEAKGLDQGGLTLLIDSGAQHHGYASDITRTHVVDDGSQIFKDLVKELDRSQQALIKGIKVGQDSMVDLHLKSCRDVAGVLIKSGILQGINVDDCVAAELERAFYPHGVGHMLGLLVHDVGGRQKNPEGDAFDPDPRSPKLRSQRVIEDGLVFTVEPGLYFIDMLLEQFQDPSHKHYSNFNWALIEELKPYGGIRIEDNISIANGRIENITRAYLP